MALWTYFSFLPVGYQFVIGVFVFMLVRLVLGLLSDGSSGGSENVDRYDVLHGG